AAKAAEPAAYWTAALRKAGVAVGPMAFQDGMFTLPYKTADGRVIRQYLADARQFAPKDEGALRADMAAAVAALKKAGLTPLAARVVDVDFMLPTYEVLYLTKPAAKPELESRLRILKGGDDIDASVFRRAGLDVVATPQPWLMVYVGPEAGHVSMGADSRESADKKLADRRKLLEGEGLRVVGTAVTPYSDPQLPELKFIVELYWVAGEPPAQAWVPTQMSSFQEASATVCFLRGIEKDECVYSCRDGRTYSTPVSEPEPGQPGPVIACPQVVMPF
ncbi:MAG: hypothetical protein KGL53_08220, partial [Elusimicrobia bacterium]|nr:hypothetical protein [Elusimicrobiota bacterium]